MTVPAFLQSPWRGYTIALVIILGVITLPWILGLSAMAFADAHGCVLHEGFVNPCVVDGVDHGKELYEQFGSVWLAILSMPIGLVALIVWCVRFGAERKKRDEWIEPVQKN